MGLQLINGQSIHAFVLIAAFTGMVFAYYLFRRVAAIKLVVNLSSSGAGGQYDTSEVTQGGGGGEAPKPDVGATLIKIYDAVRGGADAFLMAEYRICILFIIGFSLVILLLVSRVDGTWNVQVGGFAMLSFIVGGLTSIVSGYIGMKVAVFSNARTCVSAIPNGSEGWRGAFSTAMNAGGVMGFSLCGLAMLVLYVLCCGYTVYFNSATALGCKQLFEAIAGFGLGGSTIAMFGRVGGGIFTKAADVGADLAGKVVQNIPEDDPRNPGTIADNVGDNVGDVAGMGSDLFGSFAEASCAALIVGATSKEIVTAGWGALMFPVALSATGLFVSLVTHFVATDIWPVKSESDVLRALKVQIGVSTLLATAFLYPTTLFLPASFQFAENNQANVSSPFHNRVQVFFSVAVGLWGGCLIGFITEYFTSYDYQPTQEVARSTETGAATNIIYGLALGYKSAIIPITILSIDVFISFKLCEMYGVALCALGMLMTLSSCLTIDVYGPICDNAGGLAEMSGLPPSVREKTDALDAAGNTTAAIGKGFAIGSAALVSLALFGAFVTRVENSLGTTPGCPPFYVSGNVNILEPITFAALIMGAMIPYWFSAMTMKSVGKAAMEMVKEVARQFREIPGLLEGTPGHGPPEHGKCIKIATDASLKEMILPGALVIFTPIVFGIFFGVHSVFGLLAGSMSSGVQLAVSMSNTGGAWDNAKKFVEKGGLTLKIDGVDVVQKKGSDAHKAAVIGDTVGDPLKDTSGPAINIVMKLMAIISLVFADFFVSISCGNGLFKIQARIQ